MIARATLLIWVCASSLAGPQPQLSSSQVIRIADTAARSALHRDTTEFKRLAPQYLPDKRFWSVVYDNVKGTAPSQVTVEVSDTGGWSLVVFGDACK
jgi:hypothetical protein